MVNLIKAFIYKELSTNHYIFVFTTNFLLLILMTFKSVPSLKIIDINEAIVIFFITCKISIMLNELISQKIFKNFLFIDIKKIKLLVSVIAFYVIYLLLLLLIPFSVLFILSNLTFPIIQRLLLYTLMGIAYITVTTLISIFCNGDTKSIIVSIICLYIIPPIINNVSASNSYKTYFPTMYLDPATIFNFPIILSIIVLGTLVTLSLIGVNLILRKKEL